MGVSARRNNAKLVRMRTHNRKRTWPMQIMYSVAGDRVAPDAFVRGCDAKRAMLGAGYHVKFVSMHAPARLASLRRGGPTGPPLHIIPDWEIAWNFFRLSVLKGSVP